MNNDFANLLKEGYEAFARGDVQPVIDLARPDVTWGMIGHEEDVPFFGIRQGIDGMVGMLKTVGETQQLHMFQPHGFYVVDDMAFVPGIARWTMHRNGISGENEWVHVYTLKDGKIASFRGYTDTASMARAYHAEPAPKRAATR